MVKASEVLTDLEQLPFTDGGDWETVTEMIERIWQTQGIKRSEYWIKARLDEKRHAGKLESRAGERHGRLGRRFPVTEYRVIEDER